MIFPLVLLSCYDEDSIKTTIGEPKYEIKDSEDPLDHARYEIFEKTGVYVLYEYDDTDYLWNVSSASRNRLTRQTDRNVLLEGVNYLKKALLDYYDNDFKTNYFPLKILLADTVSLDYQLVDTYCVTGRSYLAIGKLRDGSIPESADELNEAKGIMHGYLWGNIIYANSLIEIPETFFEPGGDMYGIKNPEVTTIEALRKLGFWEFDETNSGGDTYFPSMANDVNDFVKMITSHSKTELDVYLNAYPILKNKYEILVLAVKTACGVDLQAIGENKPE